MGLEAKQNGLVDELGGKSKALEIAKERAGIKDATVIEFEEKKSVRDLLSQLTTEYAFALGQGLGSQLFKVQDKIAFQV